MYITFEDYAQFHTDIQESEFPLFCLKACKLVDNYTTGIDGVHKLQTAFPTDQDAEYVRLCLVEVTRDMYLFDKADAEASSGKQITSMSSGSESVSYNTNSTYALKGADRTLYLKNKITSYLRGLYDANGVSLLYMGAYPNV